MNGTPAPVVALRGVSRTYRETRALDGVDLDLDLDLAPDRIYGLVGRNGSGKTTLLSVIGQQVRPDRGGRVELFGRPGWENPEALSRTVLLRDRQRYPEDFRVRHVLLLDRGRLVLDAGLETARASARTVAGPAADVAGYLVERGLEQHVSREQRIGALRTVTVAAPHDDDARAAAARHGIEIDAVSLQSAVAAHGLVPADAVAEGLRHNQVLLWWPGIALLVHAAQVIGTSTPVALALGATRRSTWWGSVLTFVLHALLAAAVLTVFLLLERATGGWFLGLPAFDVHLFAGGSPAWALLVAFLVYLAAPGDQGFSRASLHRVVAHANFLLARAPGGAAPSRERPP